MHFLAFMTLLIVRAYIKGENTANTCAIDLSKAFDKVNHHGLFLKLMPKHIPVQLLALLENWLSSCFSCVKWYNAWSQVFCLNFGVRQGSVLSPLLFALFMDDLAKVCIYNHGLFIALYADDTILLAPSIRELEKLLRICEEKLDLLDMVINI